MEVGRIYFHVLASAFVLALFSRISICFVANADSYGYEGALFGIFAAVVACLIGFAILIYAESASRDGLPHTELPIFLGGFMATGGMLAWSVLTLVLFHHQIQDEIMLRGGYSNAPSVKELFPDNPALDRWYLAMIACGIIFAVPISLWSIAEKEVVEVTRIAMGIFTVALAVGACWQLFANGQSTSLFDGSTWVLPLFAMASCCFAMWFTMWIFTHDPEVCAERKRLRLKRFQEREAQLSPRDRARRAQAARSSQEFHRWVFTEPRYEKPEVPQPTGGRRGTGFWHPGY